MTLEEARATIAESRVALDDACATIVELDLFVVATSETWPYSEDKGYFEMALAEIRAAKKNLETAKRNIQEADRLRRARDLDNRTPYYGG